MLRVILAGVAGVVFVVAAVNLFRSDNGSDSSTPTSTTPATGEGSTTSSSIGVPGATTTSSIGATPTSPPTARRGIEGFSPIAFAITTGNGERRNWCALLATTDEQRSKGLMGQSDLGGYDGMIFRFDTDTQASFYMANVPVPLSVAWFGVDGKYVSSATMEVCTTDANQCPRYTATAPYRYALEVKAGDLEAVGVGAGSSFGAGGPCA